MIIDRSKNHLLPTNLGWRTTGLRLSSKAQLRTVRVKDDVLALEEDVAEDGEANALVGLQTAEAGLAALRHGLEVEVLGRHGGGVLADGEAQLGQLRVAREGVAAGVLVVLRALDLLVVLVDDLVVEQEEGGAGVCEISI